MTRKIHNRNALCRNALWLLAALAACAPPPSPFRQAEALPLSSAPIHWRAWQEAQAHATFAPGPLETWRALPPAVQAAAVNRWFNRVPFVEDRQLWGAADHWASPADFLRRGGDCEDYALAKLAALRQLGWREADLRLLLVQDMRRDGTEHALLWAHGAEGDVLLDNQSPHPLPADAQHRYLPRYGMNAEGFWRY